MIASLLSFLAWLGVSVSATAAFVLLYCMITPYRERELLAQGNLAAAVSLSGVTLGFALPVASALAHSVSLPDLSIWSGIAGLVQLAGYFAFRVMFPAMRAQVEAGTLALPLLHAVMAIALGLLNAAAMTW